MLEIRRIATIYFKEFEGLVLYPKPHMWQFWLYSLGLAVMLAGNGLFVALNWSQQDRNWPIVFALLGDAVGALAMQSLKKYREARAIEMLQLRMAGSFKSLDSCKRARLKELFGIGASGFLAAAEEIHRMAVVTAAFQTKAQADGESSSWRFIYDERSKDRLMNLLLVIVAGLLTLGVVNGASLDNVFEAFGSGGFRGLLLVIAFVAAFGLWVFAGVWFLSIALFDVLTKWKARFSKGPLGDRLVVSYLVRDLIALHRRPPIVASGARTRIHF